MVTLPLSAVALTSLLVGTFGFAILRGGVCTLAAIEEVALKNSWTRLQAFAETWLWVLGVFLIAHLGFGFDLKSANYEIGISTIVGAVLLALGAYINQACPFGSIAAIGSGYWSYLATPVGFFIGCLIKFSFARSIVPTHDAHTSVVFDAAPVLIIPVAAFLCWRLHKVTRHLRMKGIAREALRSYWSPLSAAIVVGISFALTAIVFGGWSYTELLADLAAQKSDLILERLCFLCALLTGAIVGGLTERGWSPKPPTMSGICRCSIGGIIMGFGSRLVPGAHDGMTLIGQPLLLPFAWLAMFTMYATLFATYTLIDKRKVRNTTA
jgi:uncharacterized membrane protein YedE/YeeE